MSNDIQSALEALAEDEGLTDNLTDAPAQALLGWAETQIKAGLDPKMVRQAVRAANRDTLDSAATVLAAAIAALEQAGRTANQPVSATVNTPTGVTMVVQPAPEPDVTPKPAQAQATALQSAQTILAAGAAAVPASAGSRPSARRKNQVRRGRKARFSARRR